jgi:plasmid stability protein
MTDEDLRAAEAARARRRDRDMEAEGRALLRPRMAKVFRQVTDAAAKPELLMSYADEATRP